MKNWHIVYLSFESGKTGRDYIGKHSTKNLLDGYLGSYKDLSFNPESKIILGYYKSAKAAITAEIQWQKVFRVVEDPKFANKSYQTSDGFDTTGYKFSDDHSKKLSEKVSGEGNPMFGRCGDLAPATKMRWYYDPVTKTECYLQSCPQGYLPGRPSMSDLEKVKVRLKDRVCASGPQNGMYGVDASGEKNGNCKIKKDQVPQIVSLTQSGQFTMKEIAAMYGVSYGTIRRVVNDPNYWCNR